MNDRQRYAVGIAAAVLIRKNIRGRTAVALLMDSSNIKGSFLSLNSMPRGAASPGSCVLWWE